MSETTTYAPPLIGQWIRLPVRAGMAVAAGRSAETVHEMIGFTFVDPMNGLVVSGDVADLPSLVDKPRMMVALTGEGAKLPWSAVGEAEAQALGLPASPGWLEAFPWQSARGSVYGAWREHPRLKGKFHAEYPDDLQVVVHEGGPRTAKTRPERIWVRVYGVDGANGDLMSGVLLNVPHQLTTLKQRQVIRFLVPAEGPPLLVRDSYLAERGDWQIMPCSRCGMTELLDAPSELMRAVFLEQTAAGAMMLTFTAICGACGGGQLMLVHKDAQAMFEKAEKGEIAAVPPEAKGTLERLKSWWKKN